MTWLQVKHVLLVVLVCLISAIGVWVRFVTLVPGSTSMYRVARVERGPLTTVVSASGTLNAVITVQVGTQVSGQIKQLFADFNTVVRRGQVIARLDPELFETRVSQARADLDTAQATVGNQEAQVERARADVENAKAALAEAQAQTARAQVALLDARRDLDRKNELRRQELIALSERDTAQATYDTAATQLRAAQAREQALSASIRSADAQLRVTQAMYHAARAQVKQKEGALRQALVDLDHTTIRAPVDGVVISRSIDVGQTVAASLQAPTLFTIAEDLTKMQVETAVAEADIGRIKLGHRVTFTVDAFPADIFSGMVLQIRKAPQILQNVVTYTVVLAVANPDGKLLPGMTANVKVVVAEKANVLKVPTAALRFRPMKVDGEMRESTVSTPPASGGSDEPGAEGTRERLVQELKLSEGQQAQLDQILREGREQRRALRATGLPEAERKTQSHKIREATRARIREILTPQQRPRYDQLAPTAGAVTADIRGRVWVLAQDGTPKPIALKLGISDGTWAEVLTGDIRAGREVLVGFAGAPSAPSRPAAPASREPRLRL